MYRSTVGRVALVALVAIVAIGVVVDRADAADRWPAKKGKVCLWVDAGGSEWSWVEMFVTHTGARHYMLQGFAQQWEGFPSSSFQPLNGNATVHYGTDVVAMITKVEFRPGDSEIAPGVWNDDFETYNGMMVMGTDFSNAGAVGTIISCTKTVGPPDCDAIYSEVVLYNDADCDPDTDQPAGVPPAGP
jgi:hypothetical protein